MKVCIIDDNKSITGLISRFLKMKGHESVVVNDGRAGLSMLEKEVFDVVIQDLAMPEFSGIDIVDSLYESGRMKDQKICVLTASSSADADFEELKAKGVKAILKKPLDLTALVSTLEKIVNSN